MPLVRRREAGRDQFGHHWENAGDAIDLPHDQCSQLLAEPALPMYSLIDHGATIEVDNGDPAKAEDDSDAGRHERATATGSTPADPRTPAPNTTDKTAGSEGNKGNVVGRSDSK